MDFKVDSPLDKLTVSQDGGFFVGISVKKYLYIISTDNGDLVGIIFIEDK